MKKKTGRKIAEIRSQLREVCTTLQVCDSLGLAHDNEKLEACQRQLVADLTKLQATEALAPYLDPDALEYQCRANLELIAKKAIDSLLFDVYHDPSINLNVALAQAILSKVH